MPYKDPERKQQWEREHREQRIARRRALRLLAQIDRSTHKAIPDPLPNLQHTSDWKVIAGLVVGFGVVILAGLTGASFPANFGPAAESNNSSWLE